MLALGLKLLASYLIGSVNGSLTLGQLGGFDIRGEGSGNAGATNALRTHGLWFAIGVSIIDFGKGALAVLVVAPAAGGAPEPVSAAWVAALCGVTAVVGHIYPFWFDFRGGKGGATAIGALAALSPLALLPVVSAWVIMLITVGYVGLATMSAAVAMFVFALVYHPAGFDPAFAFFGFAVAVLVIYAHRSNIRRMREGVEHRISGALLWRRQRQ